MPVESDVPSTETKGWYERFLPAKSWSEWVTQTKPPAPIHNMKKWRDIMYTEITEMSAKETKEVTGGVVGLVYYLYDLYNSVSKVTAENITQGYVYATGTEEANS